MQLQENLTKDNEKYNPDENNVNNGARFKTKTRKPKNQPAVHRGNERDRSIPPSADATVAQTTWLVPCSSSGWWLGSEERWLMWIWACGLVTSRRWLLSAARIWDLAEADLGRPATGQQRRSRR
ncbi:hypothetical protein Dimus_032445 [Dionaea muscipula]